MPTIASFRDKHGHKEARDGMGHVRHRSAHFYVIICLEHDLGERDLELEDCRDRVPSTNGKSWFTMQ